MVLRLYYQWLLVSFSTPRGWSNLKFSWWHPPPWVWTLLEIHSPFLETEHRKNAGPFPCLTPAAVEISTSFFSICSSSRSHPVIPGIDVSTWRWSSPLHGIFPRQGQGMQNHQPRKLLRCPSLEGNFPEDDGKLWKKLGRTTKLIYRKVRNLETNGNHYWDCCCSSKNLVAHKMFEQQNWPWSRGWWRNQAEVEDDDGPTGEVVDLGGANFFPGVGLRSSVGCRHPKT